MQMPEAPLMPQMPHMPQTHPHMPEIPHMPHMPEIPPPLMPGGMLQPMMPIPSSFPPTMADAKLFPPWYDPQKHALLGQDGRRCFDSYRGSVQHISDDKMYATVLSDRISPMIAKQVAFSKPDTLAMYPDQEVEFLVAATSSGSLTG